MKCILFDLGGVLVELWGVEPLLKLCPHLKTREEVHAAWVSSQAVRAFETGLTDYITFCKSVVPELGMQTSPVAFQRTYRTFLGNVFHGAEELILELKRSYRVACLSNTNQEHMRLLRERTDFLSLFDRAFLSYEMGHMKPDPEAYMYAAEALNLSPSEILFIDDNELNVRIAEEQGFIGMLSDSILEIRERIC